ncbi:MAG: homoserine kinase [Elusimicrobiota bacterium]
MKNSEKIHLKIPASVSNIGPGFDVLGFGIKKYLRITAGPGTGELLLKGKAENIDSDSNAVAEGFEYALSRADKKVPDMDMVIDSGIPLKKGLGSSAAARAGGIYIADKIFDLGLKKKDIARMTSRMEGHADNAVPAVAGGFTVSYFKGEKLFYRKYDISNKNLIIVIGCPDLEVSTDEARKIMPRKFSISDSVFNISRVSLLMGALLKGNYSDLKYATEDKIHQPYRKKFIPDFDKIVEETLKAGAYGTAITGSGPSIVSFTGEEEIAEKTGNTMRKIWQARDLDCEIITTGIDTRGIREQNI